MRVVYFIVFVLTSSSFEEVFDFNPVFFWKWFKWYNLEYDVGVPHALSEDAESHHDKNGDEKSKQGNEHDKGSHEVIEKLLDIWYHWVHAYLF